MSRKTITIVLTAIVVLSSFAVLVTCTNSEDASAAETTMSSLTYDGCTYEYDKYLSTGYYIRIDNVSLPVDGLDTVRIPIRLEGYDVTVVGDGVFKDLTGIRTVVIPKTVVEIGKNVFSGCTSLKEVIFMGSCPIIGEGAIPDGVKVKYLEENSDSWSNYSNTHSSEVFPLYTYTVKTSTSDCSMKYFILDGTATIYSWVSGTVIDIPAEVTVDSSTYKVTNVGPEAFMEQNFHCDMGITKVVMHEGLQVIDTAAFKYNPILETVVLPSTLKVISDEAFRMAIETNLCSQSKLDNVVLPEGLEFIGFEAFRMCYSLKEITVPSTVKYYLDDPFRVCTSLKKITVKSPYITTIRDSEFDECFALEEVSYAADITEIGSNAFESCLSLKSFTIPASVTKVDDKAFTHCANLTSITMSAGTVLKGDLVFMGTPINTVTITSGGGTSVFEKAFSADTWKFKSQLGKITKLVIDTSDTVDLSDVQNVEGGFVEFTSKATNTTGGAFPTERAGHTFGYDGSSWSDAQCVNITLRISPSIYGQAAGTVTGSGWYAKNSTVTISTKANTNYTFQKWSDGSTDLTRTITADTAKDLTAEFSKNRFNAAVVSTGHGYGEVSPSTNIAPGATVTLTAHPIDGYILDKWLVNGKAISGDTFSMPSEDVIVTATFKESNGTGTGGSDNTMLYVGIVAILVIVAAIGGFFFYKSKKSA